MLWYRRAHHGPTVYDCLREIALAHGAQVMFHQHDPEHHPNQGNYYYYGRFCEPDELYIMIHVGDWKVSLRMLLATFFHELGHFECGHKSDVHLKGFSYRDRRRFFLDMLSMEREADRAGQRLMGIYFPGIPYHANYKGHPEYLAARAQYWYPAERKKKVVKEKHE